MSSGTSQRGQLWSGTQFVLEAFKDQQNEALRNGWTCLGQLEECPETKRKHYQFAVKTPQVRMSQVIKIFKGAHIEPARNKDALLQYVKKEETRIGSLPEASNKYPSADKFLNLVCQVLFDADNIPKKFRLIISIGDWYSKMTDDDKLEALDYATTELIRQGYICELHAVNPQIRSAWKKFSTAIAFRSILDRQTDRHEEIISEVDDINHARGETNEESNSSQQEEEDDDSGSHQSWETHSSSSNSS